MNRYIKNVNPDYEIIYNDKHYLYLIGKHHNIY